MISTIATITALHEYLEVAQTSDRIAWGGDNWTSEESYGATIAYKHVVARVLAQKIRHEYFDVDEARILAERLLFRNARGIYGPKK